MANKHMLFRHVSVFSAIIIDRGGKELVKGICKTATDIGRKDFPINWCQPHRVCFNFS